MIGLVKSGKIDTCDAYLLMTVAKAKEIYADEYFNISESTKGNQTLLNVYSDPNVKLYYTGDVVEGIAVLGNCFGIQTGITTVGDIISNFGANTKYTPSENETFFFFGGAPEGVEAIKYTCGDNVVKLFFTNDLFSAAFIQTKDFNFKTEIDSTSSENGNTSSQDGSSSEITPGEGPETEIELLW